MYSSGIRVYEGDSQGKNSLRETEAPASIPSSAKDLKEGCLGEGGGEGTEAWEVIRKSKGKQG